jgi:hypothetical protein
MRNSVFLASLLLLQGCTVSVPFMTSLGSGDYNPLTLSSVDADKYAQDKQACIKQVQIQAVGDMNSNYNIMKFRECLIQKGYVLLS